MMTAAPAITPTTPPAIAPTLELFELDDVEGPVVVVEELSKEVYTVVKEANKVV